MAGILDHSGIFYQLGVLSTEQFRNSILNRNLPPPINDTLVQSGLVAKLEDIGNVISVPILGTQNENIAIHYNEDERLFPLGTFFRTTKNVNLNPYIPQDENYDTFNVIVPPVLGYPLPTSFGQKVRGPYPESYSSDRFDLINKGDKKGVAFPFNVIDSYKSLNFQKESSLGIIGGQQLETAIISKIAQIEEEANPDAQNTGYITEPVGDMVNNYVNKLRGNDQFFNTLPNDAVGWNEYNSSSNSPQGEVDSQEGVNPTMSTEIRMKSLLERTSVTQIQFTFDLLNKNKYRPLYEDRRLQGTSNEGTNARYYIGTEKNTNRGALITKTFNSSDFNGEGATTGSGQRTDIEGVGEPFGEPNKFFWTTGGEQNFNPKTLLYKTQQLVNNNQDDVFINQTRKYFKDKKQNRLISRGNAISEIELIDAFSNGNFCRVWTVTDRYSYLNAIRNTGLFTSPSGTKGFSATSAKKASSVLLDSGVPKYHPTLEDSKSERKKFMLSIENLAWADNLADLPLWEIGPGDPVTGTKGRMMWFPPYGLTFDESTSANWTATEFIGRSEPVYTYNNSKRSGSLSFKIIVDHPRVINCYRGKSNNLIERFFAGCVTPEDFLESLECAVTQNSLDEIEKKIEEKKKQKVVVTDTLNKQDKIIFNKVEGCDPAEDNCEAKRIANQSDIDRVVAAIKEFLEKQSNNTNNKVKVVLNGWCSNEVTKSKENPNNPKSISKDYAKKVKQLIEAGLGGVDKKLLNNIKYDTKGNDGLDSNTDSDYRVDVEMTSDAANSDEAKPKQEVINDPTGTLSPEEVKLIDSLIIDENAYFDFIDGNYPNYFKTISEKIKYFHPGFHSMTPEGFNTRLTFLNQCMKQGPSIYDRQTNKDGEEVGVQPQNLSFGRPPICILRIGDFFYTKVVINSLSITYDGPQFDLNPEGIGVQPMMATISLNIDIIGGQTLSGPINRLQNALSFNYYANTEMYDVRSDTVKDGNIIDGVKLGELKRRLAAAKEESLKKDVELNQKDENNKSGDQQDDAKEGVIKVELSDANSDSATINAKTEKNPSETQVGKNDNSVDDKNEMYLMVKGKKSGKIEKGPENTTNLQVSISELSKVAKPNEIKTLKDNIDTKQSELNSLKTTFINENPKTQQTKNAIKAKEDQLNDAKKDLDKYLSENDDKIEVEAYFTKSKNKTKVKKTFTITETGLT